MPTRRVTAITVIVSMTIPSLPVHAMRGGSPAPAIRQPADDPLATIRDLQTLIAKVAPADWTVEDRALSLAPGIESAFAVVRDEIAFEAYAGILRGAQGTYASRAGNAADRALLLAGLLKRRGMKVRFVLGSLDPPHRERLFARIFDTTVTSWEHPPPAGEAGSLHQRLFARASSDFNRVRRALGDRLPPVTAPAHENVRAEMDPHVWVQVWTADSWIDLDPSFAEARPGQVFGAVRQAVEELPAELHQRITIRVVAEHLSSGSLTSRALLIVARNAVDLNHVPVALLHAPSQGMGGLGAAMGRAFGRGTETWTPMLWIAGEFVPGARFDAAASTFVAEWLEFELTWPGGRTEITRRPLLDRGDAAWRSASPLSLGTLRPLVRNDEGALALQAIHNIWFSGSRHDVGAYLRGMEALLLEASAPLSGEATRPPSDDFADSFWPFAMRNLTAMFWTDHVAIPLLNDTPGVRVYPDGLRIAVFSTAPAPDDELSIAADLRRDHLRGLARAGGERTLAEKKLRFGILQGALEHEFMHDLAVAINGSADDIVSTSARLATVSLVSWTPQSAGTLPEGGQATALVRSALARNTLVVSTSTGLDQLDAWWEVDAATGDTRAVGGPGLHNVGWTTRGKGAKQMTGTTPKSYDARSALERRREFARLMAEKGRREAVVKNTANPARVRGIARGSGGSEHGVLIAAVTIAGTLAMWTLSAWLEYKVYQQIVALVGWIADGSFRRATGR